LTRGHAHDLGAGRADSGAGALAAPVVSIGHDG